MKFPGCRYSFVLVLGLLVAALPRGLARSNGSPVCPVGSAAVGGLHLAASTITTGTVADGGFRLRIGRTRVDHGGTVERPAGDTDLILDVASFKGIFVRIEGTTVDQVVPQGSLQVASACSGAVGAVTHSDSSVKSKATILIEDLTEGSYPVDVTVVVTNSGGESVYYYSRVTLVVPETLYDGIEQDEELSTLKTAIDFTGLKSAFAEPYQVSKTLFAPTNDALSSLDAKFLTENWKPHLEHILWYHTVQGTLLSSDITNGLELMTGEKDETEPIVASVTTDGISFSGSAFSASSLGQLDIEKRNGVMHKVVNTFFFPPDLADTLFDLATKAPVPYEISSLFVMSNIDDELNADGRTIFAFQESAYSLLPSKFRSRLENDPERMREFLLDHVIIGVYPRELLTNGLKVNTVSNKEHEITIEGDGMFRVWSIDDIELKTENGVAANGLVHMMDSVLLLPAHEEAVGLSTFEECRNNLYLSDLTRDDKLTEAEFLVFINRWTDVEIEEVLAEVLEALLIVGASYEFLEEMVDEGINISGAAPGVTTSPEQEASLRVVCAVTADAIHEALSLPPPPDGPRCCPEGFTGLLPFAACNSFYTCVNGVVTGSPISCAGSQKFDREKGICVPAGDLAVCEIDLCETNTIPPKKVIPGDFSKDDSVKLFADTSRGNLQRNRRGLRGR